MSGRSTVSGSAIDACPAGGNFSVCLYIVEVGPVCPRLGVNGFAKRPACDGFELSCGGGGCSCSASNSWS